MRRNNPMGKVIFVLILVVAIILAFVLTGVITKTEMVDLGDYKQAVFFGLLLIIAGPAEVIVGKKIGGRR